MYLGDYWELRVHIETADTCGPAAFINHVLRKFIVELYHNLLVGVPPEIWRKLWVPSKISISWNQRRFDTIERSTSHRPQQLCEFFWCQAIQANNNFMLLVVWESIINCLATTMYYLVHAQLATLLCELADSSNTNSSQLSAKISAVPILRTGLREK